MTSKIVGNALYLELVANPALSEDDQKKFLGWQSNGVKQIIVFPSVERDEGKPTKPVIMTRIVTAHSPRAQWDWTFPNARLKPTPMDEIVARSEGHSYLQFDQYSTDEWDALTNTSKSLSLIYELNLLIDQELLCRSYEWADDKRVVSATQGWQVRDSKPIAVEFTSDDHDQALNRITPQAVIRRINKVRATLDKFPEKLVSFA
jgi:hypothetical protein